MTYACVAELLDDARSRIQRLTPVEAAARVAKGARLVDIRPAWQREADGEIPGSVIVERNHLEWRLHPDSGAALTGVTADQEWIVVCTAGYTSSLAADSLRSLGLSAADLIGGIQAWVAAGFGVAPGASAVETVVSGPTGDT